MPATNEVHTRPGSAESSSGEKVDTGAHAVSCLIARPIRARGGRRQSKLARRSSEALVPDGGLFNILRARVKVVAKAVTEEGGLPAAITMHITAAFPHEGVIRIVEAAAAAPLTEVRRGTRCWGPRFTRFADTASEQGRHDGAFDP